MAERLPTYVDVPAAVSRYSAFDWSDVEVLRRAVGLQWPNRRETGTLSGEDPKRKIDLARGLVVVFASLLEPDSRWEPMSPLRPSARPTSVLAVELTRLGHKVGANVAGDRLHYTGGGQRASTHGALSCHLVDVANNLLRQRHHDLGHTLITVCGIAISRLGEDGLSPVLRQRQEAGAE